MHTVSVYIVCTNMTYTVYKCYLCILYIISIYSYYTQVAVIAPTGIAAVNVGGSTVHSFAGIGIGECITPFV